MVVSEAIQTCGGGDAALRVGERASTRLVLGNRAATFLVAIAVVAALSSCAFCRIQPRGGVEGVAIGHAHCRVTADGAKEIKGGALSNNLSETLAAGITALSAYFGVGAL